MKSTLVFKGIFSSFHLGDTYVKEKGSDPSAGMEQVRACLCLTSLSAKMVLHMMIHELCSKLHFVTHYLGKLGYILKLFRGVSVSSPLKCDDYLVCS